MIEQGVAIPVSASFALPQAVRDDLARVESTHGPQRLKNAIERAIVRRWVRGGDQVLDAGIGTGRIGLALDLENVRLTGLDRSPAMLDRCRIAAGGRPVEFVEGDMTALPFDAATFDSVVSIDAFSGLGSWREHLDELLRVARPAGRVIVDVGSQDHIDSVAERRGRVSESGDASAVALGIDAIVAFARERGVGVRAIVPYGVLLGALVPNRWLIGRTAALDERIERLVSWIGTDERLFDCAAFIERRIIGELSPRLAARMVVVFERGASVDDAHDATARARRLDTEMHRDGLDLVETASRHEDGAAAFAAELAAHLSDARSCVFVCSLLRMAECTALPSRVTAALPASFADEWTRNERRIARERALDAMLALWPAIMNGALTFHGVDLGAALATSLAREIHPLGPVTR